MSTGVNSTLGVYCRFLEREKTLIADQHRLVTVCVLYSRIKNLPKNEFYGHRFYSLVCCVCVTVGSAMCLDQERRQQWTRNSY